MFISTPKLNEKSFNFSGPPHSITLIEEENLKLSSKGLLNYKSESFSSDDDPFLIIHWVENGVMDALLEITGNQLIHLPEKTIFLDITSLE